MTLIRKDIAKLGVWSPTLVWYARAVAELQKRPVATRISWTYLGAMHGFNLNGWISRGIIKKTDPLPSQSEQDRMWDQCQHAQWYFLPWHRGYVAAFEAIISQTVKDLGGPVDWALPYWNYLNATVATSQDYPKEFLDAKQPDGSPNPLSNVPRGPARKLGPIPGVVPNNIDLSAMGYSQFTNPAGALGFGGVVSGFAQSGTGAGAMEFNPHNRVHVMVGYSTGTPGYMINPDYAALDPIFWIHHCNIDRLWAAWLTQSKNVQENRAAWSDGPTPRGFAAPDPTGQLVNFTPGQTLPGKPLAPQYDDLYAGTGIPPVPAPAMLENVVKGSGMTAKFSATGAPAARLLGTNTSQLSIDTAPVTTRVKLSHVAHPTGEAKTLASFGKVFLNLENIRGATPTGLIKVYVGVPGSEAMTLVDSVELFGLGKVSDAAGPHGGNGMSVALDISNLAHSLTLQSPSALHEMEVRIEQPESPMKATITVERVSVFTQ